MRIALWLLATQGVIGAFDTIYYHEWRARLAARGKAAAVELKLHASRDFLYAVLFGTLPFLAWRGSWALALLAVVIAEIVLTLWDFVAEIAVRRSLGDVYAGERVTHAVMGILYGGMLAFSGAGRRAVVVDADRPGIRPSGDSGNASVDTPHHGNRRIGIRTSRSLCSLRTPPGRLAMEHRWN